MTTVRYACMHGSNKDWWPGVAMKCELACVRVGGRPALARARSGERLLIDCGRVDVCFGGWPIGDRHATPPLPREESTALSEQEAAGRREERREKEEGGGELFGTGYSMPAGAAGAAGAAGWAEEHMGRHEMASWDGISAICRQQCLGRVGQIV